MPAEPSHSPVTFPRDHPRLIWESRTAPWELSRTQLPRTAQLCRSTGKVKIQQHSPCCLCALKGKKGNGVKNSIVLFILWAVSAEMCFVSTLSSAASSALLSPFPRTVFMIPRDFLLKHAHRDALRVCPRAHLRAAPSALPGCSPVQVWGTAAQLSGMCPQNCWKQTPSCALLPGDTCPECSLQRRNVCEHGIKCKPFSLEGCFTVQNNTCNHPQSISWSTGHGRAPEKPHSLLAGQGSRTRYPREGLAVYNTLTPIPEAKL